MGQSVRKREGSNLRSPFVAALPRQLAVHSALLFCGIAALVCLNSCAAGLVGAALGIKGLSEDSSSNTPVVSFVGEPAPNPPRVQAECMVNYDQIEMKFKIRNANSQQLGAMLGFFNMPEGWI
jgi:hypothetical protein